MPDRQNVTEVMTARARIIEILSIGGYFGLFVGVMGQAAVLGPALRERLPALIGVMMVALPCLIVYTITFFKQSFLPPRAFRWCLLVAMGWFGTVTMFAESLLAFGQLPPESPSYALTPARCMMHAGWLSFLYLIRLYLSVRRFELEQAGCSCLIRREDVG
jgi:hypothetical protein